MMREEKHEFMGAHDTEKMNYVVSFALKLQLSAAIQFRHYFFPSSAIISCSFVCFSKDGISIEVRDSSSVAVVAAVVSHQSSSSYVAERREWNVLN